MKKSWNASISQAPVICVKRGARAGEYGTLGTVEASSVDGKKDAWSAPAVARRGSIVVKRRR